MSAREFVEKHRKLESEINEAVRALILQYEKDIGLAVERVDIDLLHQRNMGGEKHTIDVTTSVRLDIN